MCLNGKTMENPEETQKTKREGDDLENTQPQKKIRVFSAKDFRKQLLNSAQKLPALQGFLYALKTHDYVPGYLESGGSCLELLQILELDSTIPPILIFDILNKVLLKITANHPRYYNQAQEACRYLLHSYIALINKMLNLSSTKEERRSILQLLTTVVTFDPSLAKEILLQVNFHQTNLEMLTAHTGKNRNYFLHFLTAFLVNGHYPALVVLLEKKALLSSILRGLQYDLPDTVCLVLTAMKNHILENPYVSKTMKMKTFNTLVVRDIVNLYNWKGPESAPSLLSKKPKKSAKVVQVDQYAKSKVSASVHDFLLTLCTSHKLGVTFKDPLLGLGKKNQNVLLYTVLMSLERPWEHSYGSQLVIGIVGACPDLAKTVWNILKEFIVPRAADKWIKAMGFARDIVRVLQPTCVEFAVEGLGVYQLGQVITILLAPVPILKTIIPENQTFETSAIKQTVLQLLVDMLQGITSYLTKAKTWLTQENHRKLHGYLSKYISHHFPSAPAILSNWNQPSEEETIKSNPHEHLDAILTLLELYKTLSPSLLEALNIPEVNLQEFLLEISETCPETAASLQTKLIKIFVDIHQEQFASKTELFAFSLRVLFGFYHETSEELPLVVLRTLLNNTGCFEGAEHEVDIWINAVLNLKNYDGDLVENLVEIIRKVQGNSSKYLKIVTSLEQTRSASGLFIGFLEHVLENPPGKSMKRYLEFLIINVFHTVSPSKTFWVLTEKYPVLPKNLLEYVKNWTENSVACPINKYKGRLEIFPEFSKTFLEGELEDMLEAPKCLQQNFLDAAMFYFGNLVEFGEVTQKHLDNLEKLVKILDKKPSFVQSLLGNPTLIHHFSLLKLSDSSKSLSTKFVCNCVKILGEFEDIQGVLGVYHEKILKDILKILKKPSKYPKLDQLEVFQLNYEQLQEILSKPLVTSPVVSQIITYGLSVTPRLDHPLTIEILTKIREYFQNETEKSPDFSKALLEYLQVYPAQIQVFDNDDFLHSLLGLEVISTEQAELCVFLLLRKSKETTSGFLINLPESSLKKAVVFPVLTNVEPVEELYKKLEAAIGKALVKPQKAGGSFVKHYEGLLKFLQKFYPEDLCVNFVDKVPKFEVTEIFHACFLEIICGKALENSTNPQKHAQNIIMIFVHLQLNILKRKDKSQEDLEKLVKILEVFQRVLGKLPEEIQVALSENETFKLYCKFCLKFGIAGEAAYLEVLSKLVLVLDGLKHEQAKALLDMCLSHSGFLEVMLGQANLVKTALVTLWFNLVASREKLMEQSHISVLLSGYLAMNTSADRMILKLLRVYASPSAQTNFHEYQPILWDRAAASHYSIRSNVDRAIWRQPKIADVLNILQIPHIINTIKSCGATNDMTYDLQFLLPVFSQLLAPENPVPVYLFHRSGALSLAIIALSSEDASMRQMALHVLKRFHMHMEAKQGGKDNLLWIRFVEAVVAGTSLIPEFKLNNFAGVFLARMGLILSENNHSMYVPLSHYLNAKQHLDFSTVPELYTLLHSCNLNYKEHRVFILEILRDGLKTKRDLTDFHRSMAYKLISELYSSCVSDAETQLLILEVLESISKLGSSVFLRSHSLLVQLHTMLTTILAGGAKTRGVFLGKLLRILCSLVKLESDDHCCWVGYTMVMRVVNQEDFEDVPGLYEVLWRVVQHCPKLITDEDLRVLLKKNPGEKVCRYMFENGCRYMRSEECRGEAGEDSAYYLRMLFYEKLSERR